MQACPCITAHCSGLQAEDLHGDVWWCQSEKHVFVVQLLTHRLAGSGQTFKSFSSDWDMDMSCHAVHVPYLLDAFLSC